jgi:DNA-binding NarL/FixJ family response regulator
MNEADMPAARAAGAQPARPPIAVLIVDDHAEFRVAVAHFLRDLPHVRIAGEARDGAEALRMAEQLAPDLVLMDLTMPVLDGLEATRAIKARAGVAPKVIIVTMYAGAACRTAALHAGADAFVPKPDLVARLATVLDELFPQP